VVAFARDNGSKAVVEKKLGDKVASFFVEKVPEAADAERVFRSPASPGLKAKDACCADLGAIQAHPKTFASQVLRGPPREGRGRRRRTARASSSRRRHANGLRSRRWARSTNCRCCSATA
jgi:hypothetical protein